MVDIDALRKEIDDSGMTIVSIADKMGVNKYTIHNKLNEKTEFTVSEIEKLSDILHLTVGQRNAIFFKK